MQIAISAVLIRLWLSPCHARNIRERTKNVRRKWCEYPKESEWKGWNSVESSRNRVWIFFSSSPFGHRVVNSANHIHPIASKCTSLFRVLQRSARYVEVAPNCSNERSQTHSENQFSSKSLVKQRSIEFHLKWAKYSVHFWICECSIIEWQTQNSFERYSFFIRVFVRSRRTVRTHSLAQSIKIYNKHVHLSCLPMRHLPRTHFEHIYLSSTFI